LENLTAEKEEAPASRSGASAIYLVVWLGRACPRFNANKAQKAKKYEAERAWLRHVIGNVNDRTAALGCGQDTKFATGRDVKLSTAMPKPGSAGRVEQICAGASSDEGGASTGPERIT
jgi:hypothetical protein